MVLKINDLDTTPLTLEELLAELDFNADILLTRGAKPVAKIAATGVPTTPTKRMFELHEGQSWMMENFTGVTQLDDVYMEREFEVLDASEAVSCVSLKLGKPRQNLPRLWDCPFQIEGLGESEVRFGFGIDGPHALHSALQLAHTMLNYFARHEQKKITWKGMDDLWLLGKST